MTLPDQITVKPVPTDFDASLIETDAALTKEVSMNELNKLFQQNMGRPMKHRKESRSNQLFQLALKVIAVTFFCLLALAVYDSNNANATDKDYRPSKLVVNKNDIDKSVDATANSDSSSLADSNSVSESSSGSSNGDQVSMNSSQFYALSLTHPNAVDCFVGAQGGAADDGTSGFLGFHYLNKSCWMKTLAAEERDIELNARLKCHDRHYRNAIAFDRPKGTSKRDHCINLVMDSGMALMESHKADLADIIAQQNKAQEQLEACHERVDDANERTARCVEAVAK